MYSPQRPRSYEGRGPVDRGHAITNATRDLDRLKAIEAAHKANPAMDVVDWLEKLPGFYLFGVRGSFQRAAREIEELGFPDIAETIAGQATALDTMERTVRAARETAHQAYRHRQAEIIVASLSDEAREWLKGWSGKPGQGHNGAGLSDRGKAELLGHNLMEGNGTGYFHIQYLGKDVWKLLHTPLQMETPE